MKSVAVGTLMTYVILEGIDSTLLKWMQRQGETMMHGHGSELNPIRFSNVYFVSFMVVGIILVISDYRRLPADLKNLDGQTQQAIAGGAVSGMFIGPLCFFESLKHLSVIGQSLLFSVLLPISALLALGFLKERLPKGFALSLALITTGLVISSAAMGGTAEGGGIDLQGIILVLISVLAYATFDITNRSFERRNLGQGVTLGIGAIVSALAFALIEVGHFGPHYFRTLELWWVLVMVGAYALLIRTVGSIVQRYSLLAWPVATVELWGSLAIVVSVFCAAVILGDPVNVGTLLGVSIVLAGVSLPSLIWHQKPEAE
jgi:drug/metabolite transporter (DMT)-like permease